MTLERNWRDPETAAERKAALLSAYEELSAAREELAHKTRVFEGYKMLAMSGLVLSGESVTGAERVVEQWLK